MNIIDHLSVGAPDLDAAKKFYTPVMEALGCNCLAASDGFVAYGKDAVQFLVMLPADGKAFTVGNGTHICFVAASRQNVDRFYEAALEHGGSDEGAPGPRDGYPKPDIYTTFVRDPFGNKLEAIFNGFAVS